jgi:hypothetical protein
MENAVAIAYTFTNVWDEKDKPTRDAIRNAFLNTNAYSGCGKWIRKEEGTYILTLKLGMADALAFEPMYVSDVYNQCVLPRAPNQFNFEGFVLLDDRGREIDTDM